MNVPGSIPMRSQPGGVVVLIFSKETGRMVSYSRVTIHDPERTPKPDVERVREIVANDDEYVAVYDGDTGERIGP